MLFYFYIFFCLLAYRTHQAVQHFGSTSGHIISLTITQRRLLVEAEKK